MSRNGIAGPAIVVSGVLLACAASLVGAPAAAHTDAHVDVAALFRAIDTNHDGQVSLTEYMDHAHNVFRECDTHHDGTLSGQERQACTRTLDQNGVPVSGSSSSGAKAMDVSQEGAVPQQGYDA